MMMMMSQIVSRIPVAKVGTAITSRTLSTHGVAAVEKLRGALEEYRVHNYAQCMPTRFKKDLIRAASSGNSDRVALDGMQRVLANINMEHRVTRSDIETIFREIGGSTDAIPVEKLMRII